MYTIAIIMLCLNGIRYTKIGLNFELLPIIIGFS